MVPARILWWEFGTVQSELGIISDNLTNQQRINRSTLSIVGYRLALEMALSVCRLKTKSDNRQIELSVRTINRYSRMIVWRKIVLTMLSIHRFKCKNSPMITQSIEVHINYYMKNGFGSELFSNIKKRRAGNDIVEWSVKKEGLELTLSNDLLMKGWNDIVEWSVKKWRALTDIVEWSVKKWKAGSDIVEKSVKKWWAGTDVVEWSIKKWGQDPT